MSHPVAVTEGVVHLSRGMLLYYCFELLLFYRVYFDLVSKLGETSFSLARSCLYPHSFDTMYSVICCSQFGYHHRLQGTVSHFRIFFV